MRVAWRDPEGRLRESSKVVRGLRSDAVKVRDKLRDARNKGLLGQPSTETFAELMGSWIALNGPDQGPHTRVNYESQAKRWILPALGRIRTTNLTVGQIETLYGVLRNDLSPASIAKIHWQIRGALDLAVRWGRVSTNVARLAQRPKIVRQEVTVPTTEIIVRIIAEGEHDYFGPLVALGVATGMRRGELCGLRWSDVDWVNSALWIRRGIIDDHYKAVVKKSTKTDRDRRIALGPKTLDALRVWRQRCTDIASACSTPQSDESYIFHVRPGGIEPLMPKIVSERFRRTCNRLGYTGFSFKDATRHVHATRLIAAGTDVRTVAGRLGHATAATTLNVYAHFLPSADREAASQIEAILAAENPT